MGISRPSLPRLGLRGAREAGTGGGAAPGARGTEQEKAAGGPSGIVLQIQRMSTEDGPGLRSTAFLKGCPLSCAWCHNPESIKPGPEVQWIGLRCIAGSTTDGCGACLRACRVGAISRGPDGAIAIDRGLCRGCGACADACPAGAMERLGERMDAAELADELLKDAAYFRRSDRGGITLSGGEASAQPDFAREVFRRCREAGLHTALDTCGFASWENLDRLYDEVDLVLFDLKEADTERHRGFTGQGNELIFRNLELTARRMRDSATPAALWLRSPVIPGATAREENYRELGKMVAAIAPPRLERWELCAFNNLCADKYRRLGKDWAYARSPLMPASEMESLAAAARLGSGGIVEVTWTGSARIEPERKQP